MRELLVVGAGPAGLSAALAARSLGLAVTVLEAEPADRVRPGSRALFVHQETLQRLDRMSPGLGARIAAFGITWRSRSTFYRGRCVYTKEFPVDVTDGLPPYTSLRQVDTERFLFEACCRAGVEFVWDAPAETVHADGDRARITDRTGRTWTAWYVIAADGARSAVRGSLGITLQGARSEDYRVAVDLADASGETDLVCHYRHRGVEGRNAFVVPFSGGRQVDVQCLGRDDAERLSRPDQVRQWLPELAGPGCLDRILWISHYPCLQLVADTFVDRHRRVLLVGEAAHLFAPLGARGMNSGIADADAAATAVAIASRACNPDRAAQAIEDFHHNRRQAAEHNRMAAGTALAHLRASTVGVRARQAAAAAFAPVVPRLGTWLDKAPFGPRDVISVSSGRY
jgi:3-(3-hydroxy-phenyl)propionate hydroxylase